MTDDLCRFAKLERTLEEQLWARYKAVGKNAVASPRLDNSHLSELSTVPQNSLILYHHNCYNSMKNWERDSIGINIYTSNYCRFPGIHSLNNRVSTPGIIDLNWLSPSRDLMWRAKRSSRPAFPASKKSCDINSQREKGPPRLKKDPKGSTKKTAKLPTTPRGMVPG